MSINKRIALVTLILYVGLLAYAWSQTPTSTYLNDAGQYVHVFFSPTFIKSAIVGYLLLVFSMIMILKLYRWMTTPRPEKPKPQPQKGPYLKPRKPL